MKRALYEWGAILFVTITVTCAGFRFASVITDKADVSMFLGDDEWVLVGNGAVIWTNSSDTPLRIEEYDQGQIVMPTPPTDVHFAFPGVTYRKVTRKGIGVSWPIWELRMLRVSLVLPTLISAFLALFFIWRYRRIRLAAVGRPESKEASSETPSRS
jgi:hypothetical protein